ncbi:interferon-induced GTP-binding protein Mx1-like [Tachysurus fulvidraco]|uniref:interferon-induced GTP-binding protein Mx1-like n=1 Tax=Tachysurus fulvidraco TaxID=1234273 RepID=UPI001FEE4B41|nr:interferon-induced GTP-binding protein Mx1-like [Tachysurus fulvidraco]
MSAILNEPYELKVRPCIDLIDSLRALGLEKDLELPAIVVIGDQSSGKSSVLEALSGVALPRGSGMVTRCPLELKMTKNRNKNCWHGKIRYLNYVENFNNPADVEKIIKEAQENIAGPVGISDELISLEVISADVPDLTLIDLPGIVRVPKEDQPKDICEQSKRLTQKFIEKQGTIILVVVQSNVDIGTSEALKMAKEVDPNGERTLGILTKPDLVVKGTEDAVVSIINNEIIYLTKSYMIVKCREQQEIQDRVILNKAIETEKIFFENHPQFSTLYDEGKATIPNLAEKLTLQLVSQFERYLPRLEEQIQKDLHETLTELHAYGPGLPTEPNQRINFLTDKITAFTKDVINLSVGEDRRNMPHVNIFSSLRKHFDDWMNYLDQSVQNFNKSIEKELQEYEKKYRGRELPSFINYKTFEIILKDQLEKLEEPAIRKLNEISGLTRKDFIQLAQLSFPAFPNLFKTAKTKIEIIKQAKESEAESLLRTQFKMELMICTQDSIYKDTLRMLKSQEEEEERITHGVAPPATHSLYNLSNSEGTREELMRHLKTYYMISTKRLADQVLLVIRYMMVQESAVQLEREMIQLIQGKVNIEELLKEDPDIISKRNNLKSRQKQLRYALNLCAIIQRLNYDL